ncbi:hypothetical protein E4U12_007862 [Claviceps purpurea]|nr:hypothetical protein E4U12_007862 [Claviceps purpurea]
MDRASEPVPEQAFEPLQTFGSSEDAIESVGIASSRDDLRLGPYDPLIVKGKGRPKGSLGPGSRSHRRDPTLFDRALNQECNKALQNSSSAPSSSAPSVRKRKRRLPHPEFAVPDAPNSPPTTTNASATIKALEWAFECLDVHGDTYEAGTQMPRASQRIAPPLEDLEAPFSLGGPGDIILGDSEGLAIEVEDDVTNEAENGADIAAAHHDTGGDDVATREYWDGVVQEHEGVK